jgi:hypothetical protein
VWNRNEQDLVEARMAPRIRKNNEIADMSVRAEWSIHDVPVMRHAGAQPISEQPNESEHASSPQGTIGEILNHHQDVMSENIETRVHHKFRQNNFKEYNEEMSNFAGKSEITKFSLKNDTSQVAQYQDNPRLIPSFSIAYDRLYSDFQ